MENKADDPDIKPKPPVIWDKVIPIIAVLLAIGALIAVAVIYSGAVK